MIASTNRHPHGRCTMSNSPKLPQQSDPLSIKEQWSLQARLFAKDVLPKVRVMASVTFLQISYMLFSQTVVFAFEYLGSDLLSEFEFIRMTINALKITSFFAMFVYLVISESEGLFDLRQQVRLIGTVRDDE